MIEIELVEGERPIAVLRRDSESDLGGWSRLQECLARGVVGGGTDFLEVRADVLLAELEVLREIRRLFSTNLRLGEALQSRLHTMASDRKHREAAVTGPSADSNLVLEQLAATSFKRVLKPFQLRNLCRITTLPHGADFSVPGAGKTTTALANFALQRSRGHVARLLVVAPLAAFASWKEDLAECFNDEPMPIAHLGQKSPIPSTARILITNYHRLASDYDRLRSWVSREPTHVVLDEAHRVKRGRAGVHGRAALDLAFAATRRDVLTGTPAPQGAHDLVAIMRFLYPGQAAQILPQDAFVEQLGRVDRVLSETQAAIRKYFVRTRKSDLGLPPTRMSVVTRPMGPVQAAIYDALVGRYQGRFRLGDPSRRQFRRLGQIVMYLLEAATNPLLLLAGSDENDLEAFRHEPLTVDDDEHVTELLARYSQFETPWKYQEVRRILEEAAASGGKVIVWTTFVRNIRYLADLLAKWNPAVVHGGVPPRDGAPGNAATTREEELDRFRFDDQCRVLLANPAACGEGVSLHHWCHHAVYLDRTFNAGHFLQSQDRIHRLGLDETTETHFTILRSAGSIDDVVDRRLREKVTALAQLLDDPGLVRVSLPGDELSEYDSDPESSAAVSVGDERALIDHIRGSSE